MAAHPPGSPARPRRRDAAGIAASAPRTLSPWLAAASVVVFVLLTAAFEGNSPAWTAFDDLGELLAAAVGSAACWTRTRRERSLYRSLRELQRHGSGSAGDVALQRQSWIACLALSAGVGAWAAGQLGWSVYEIGFGVTPPSPSVLDILFLSAPILIVAGLIAMVRTPAGHLSHLRGVAEGLFIAAGFFLLSWSLIGSTVIAGNTSTFGEVVNLAYPVLDAVALAAVLFVALNRSQDPPSGLGLLALGIVFVALSDSAFWYLSDTSGVSGATPLDAGWVAGFLLIGLAAQRRGPQRKGPRRQVFGRSMLVLPVLPAVVGVVVIVVKSALDGDLQSEGTVLGILASVIGLGAALLVALSYENRSLLDNLAERVRERTAELHATERHYRALVQRSSDIVMVVDPDLHIRYVSDSIRSIFGYPPERLVGHDLAALGESAAAALSDALDRVIVTPGQSVRVQWELTDPSGHRRRAESSVANLLADPDVGAFVLNTRDDTDRRALEDQLRHQALHDPLTALANRALLSDRASQAFARARRTGAAVAVITLDVDSFKLINDRLGHIAGDELLRSIAQRLQAAVRPEDTVARTGGDEFVVLVDSVVEPDDALDLAKRIHEAMLSPFMLDTGRHTITASIGVAVDVAPHSNFEQLLSDADVAMYAVKSGGRDAVQLFESSMHEHARERFRLQEELRQGIDRSEFWLLYQPEFANEGERLEGFEALVRWNSPTRGLIGPDRFIPLAEESGLIVPLGRWILREALRAAVSWDHLAGNRQPLTISVNVSAVQLGAPSLVADVEDALSRSDIDPARVVLEITESSLIDSSPRVVEILRSLKGLGVRLAIDDFGTGYASISYLQRIPVDILKIDRSFVTGSGESQRGRELLEAILNIGQVLSLKTVAEGVEEPSQLAMLRSAGCDLVQGYLFSQPLPQEQAQRLIARSGGMFNPIGGAPAATR